MVKIRNIIINKLRGLVHENTPPELLENISWDLPGTSLKKGSRSTVNRIEIGRNSYVFKQYKSLKLHRRLRYALTRSRARQSWENGQTLSDLGIPVVRPLAFFEETFLKIPQRALLIMPFQEGTSLDKYPHLDKIAPSLKEIFKTMAEHRVTHGDLKATNILIDKNGNPQFIDIDASLVHRQEKSYQKARQKDEARFLKNWQDNPEAAAIFSDIFR